MEIREIRIGNRIEYLTVQNPDRWEEIVVSPVTFGRLSMEPSRFRPIELTPEWLERCGFIDDMSDVSEGNITILDLGYLKLGKGIFGNHVTLFDNEWRSCGVHVDYVHTLQNLYYDLKGEELAIDKTSLKN